MHIPLGVMGICYRREGGLIEYLVLLRSPSDGAFWQPVTGGVEDGELVISALRREVREETGLTPVGITPPFCYRQFFHKAKWWITECVFGVEVPPNAEVTLSEEHTDYRWCVLEEALQMLKYEGNRELFRHLDEALRTGQMPVKPDIVVEPVPETARSAENLGETHKNI